MSLNSNCRILASELNSTLPKYNFICALYLGKTNLNYQFTGLIILCCLAAIYILYMYLKRTNKQISEYMLWNLWIYVSDNRSRESESDLKKVTGVGVGFFLIRLRNPGFVNELALLHSKLFEFFKYLHRT